MALTADAAGLAAGAPTEASPAPTVFKTDVVKGVVGTLMAVSDNSGAAMTVLSALAPMSAGTSAIVGLILKYGTLGVASFLKSVTTPTFTEDEVAKHLAGMVTVEAQDAASFLG